MSNVNLKKHQREKSYFSVYTILAANSVYDASTRWRRRRHNERLFHIKSIRKIIAATVRVGQLYAMRRMDLAGRKLRHQNEHIPAK